MTLNGSLRVKKKVVVGIAEGLLDFQAQLEGRILVSALNLCVVAPAHAQPLAESLLGVACASRSVCSFFRIPPVSSFLCDPFGVFLWFIIVPNWVKVKFFSKISAFLDAISVICPREGIFVIQYISLREVRLYG